MRLNFANYKDRTQGRACLTRADVNALVCEAVNRATAMDLPDGLRAIVLTTLNLTEPCEALELKSDQELGVLITWAEFYPGQDRPLGVLRLEKTEKGYRVFQIAGGMMSQLANGMDVLTFDPPIAYTVKVRSATIAQVMALQHHVHLPRDVANIIGNYVHGVDE